MDIIIFTPWSKLILTLVIIFSVLMTISLVIICAIGAASQEKKKNSKRIAWDGYINLPSHILLLIFTFGIYHMYWIYRTTDRLNIEGTEPNRSPSARLLLCVFVPFYIIYWYFKSAQRIDRLSAGIGLYSELSSISIVLSFFVPIVAPIIFQEKINTISKEASVSEGLEMRFSGSIPEVNFDEEIKSLKKYKDLVDEGIISSDEFETKKKEIMRI